jgi:hypothetical protein
MGDQLTAELIDVVGVFFGALVTAFFSAFVVPLFEGLASLLGLGGG